MSCGAVLGVFRVFRTFKKFIYPSVINISASESSSISRSFLCQFQLEYADYQFNISQAHKVFKEYNREDYEEKKQLFDNLMQTADYGLKKISGGLMDDLERYFLKTRTNQRRPRIGIHLQDENEELVEIIMTDRADRSHSKKVSNYTIFEKVVATGLPYKDNCIPKTILTKNGNSYKHEGIKVESVKEYCKLRFRDHAYIAKLRNSLFKRLKVDEKWAKMANTNESQEPFGKLYKSHIAVPITFRQHVQTGKLNHKFVRLLDLPEDGRTILGFIVADHLDPYYFCDKNERHFNNIDINILYQIADILSLLIVTKLTYVDCSKTVNDFVSIS